MGIHQLKKLKKASGKRNSLAGLYDDLLGDLPLILPPHPAEGDIHSWHLIPYPLKPENNVWNRGREFVARMFTRGIGAVVHYIPLHLHHIGAIT